MYNKKVLIDSLKNLGSAKAPVKRQDVLVDPSGNPLMSNGGLNEKPYKKVSIQKSNIQGKGLFADEPIRAGEIIGLSHIKSSFQKDGETYLKSKETPVIGAYYNHSDDAFNVSSITQGNKRYLRALKNIQPGEEIAGNYYEDNDPTLETPDDFKKGGSLPKMPRKKNSRAYSRSLDATNKFFTENSFFAKPKSRKNKVYDPNAKYYEEGGALLTKEVTCKKCGWEWDAADGGDDITTCHKCGGQGLVHAQKGGITSQEDIDAANTAMMKARLAYADMHGNPAAKRMINLPDNPYQFDNGNTGTHYMASMDNYAVPQIQDENGVLQLGNYGPESNEAIRFDSDEDANYFAENYKDVSPAFIEAELTPEEIQEYAKGGFIIEDISVPELTKANLGKIVKTARRPVSRTLITPPSQRGVTTYLPPNENSVVDLRNIPIDLDVKQLKFPLTIAGDSGYFSAYPNNKVEDNIFHFATKMTNPMEAGRAMKLINDSFPQAFPSILEPYSLSLDSYNLLLNMAKRKDWDMSFENHIPLNFVSEKSKLFDGIEGVPTGFRTGRVFNPKMSAEMIDRINADLQGRGLMEKAYFENVTGGDWGEIRIPNYKLTRKYNLGGIAKVASKLTPGNALRASLYKGVNPANYNIIEKFTGMPSELYNNTFNNDNRAFRTGMSLKFGAPEYLSKLLNNLDVSKAQWDKFSEADKMMAIKYYDPEIMKKLEDIGKRRLDAWAVGLNQPQEYNTLEQIGDNTYKMLDLQHTPQFFAERKNDIIANSFKGQAWDGKRDMLVGLTKDFYDLSPHPMQKSNPGDNRWANLRRSQIDEFLGKPAYHHPWMQTYKVGKSPDPEFTDAIYDNDSYGVRGGYRWDVRDTPEGMQWKAYDKWDLNPFEKRGSAFINPGSTAKKYLSSTYFKPLQNVEALSLVGGKPFNIENNFLVDPKTFKTIKQWEDGGSIDYTLGDEIDEATMKKLEKLGYTFEKI
jgi:hypothetical protein